MKEIFRINSHIYKNTTVSMRTRGVFVFLSKGGYMNCLLMLFTQGKKFKNPVSKDNPPCKNQIVNLVI